MEELLKIYNGISKGINDFCIDNVDNVETIRIFTDNLMIAFSLRKHPRNHEWVLLGEFRPNLSPVAFINDSQWWTTIKEVTEDCQGFMDYMVQNNLNINSAESYAYAIISSIKAHMAKYHRILFPDLCAYIECQFHILKVLGYSEISLKESFPLVLMELINLFPIKMSINVEWSTSPVILDFKNTGQFEKLKSLIANR